PLPRTHTLSLHDALPIFQRTAIQFGTILRRRTRFWTASVIARAVTVIDTGPTATLTFMVGTSSRDRQWSEFLKRGFDRIGVRLEDRKSTRLNSSHVAISY